jgi:hypothetical protein
MIKLIYIFLMLFSLVTLSQETKKIIITKDTDTAVNVSLDSLSKVYKKEVVFYSVFLFISPNSSILGSNL